ncbi:MAG: aldo/keto reductase [Proteobacteria bacterium]|nr:aldo/keto reductase [Pseudomonadota bacterium]
MSSEMSRRRFLAQSAALAASVTFPVAGSTTGAPLTSQASDGTATMRTRRIPGTDEYLPVVGLGASRELIKMPAAGKELPISLIQSMVDHGGRVIDTSPFFRPDPPIIGDVIKEMQLKDDLFLISKITVNGKEEGIAHLEKAVENLGKRPIDALLIHNMRQMDVHWPTLKEWKDSGRVRYIGVSLTRRTDYGPLMDFMKKERPDLVMTGYSITQQGPAKELLPLAADIGVGILGAEPFKARDDGAFFSVVAGKPLPEWTSEFDCKSWAQFSLKYILSNPAMT